MRLHALQLRQQAVAKVQQQRTLPAATATASSSCAHPAPPPRRISPTKATVQLATATMSTGRAGVKRAAAELLPARALLLLPSLAASACARSRGARKPSMAAL